MINFQLVALSGTKYDDEAYEIILPTLEGEIGVLQDHMPLVSVATNGVIAVRKNSKDLDRQRDYFAISGGVIEVSDNTLRVLVDEADEADTINQAEAEAAHQRALKLKSEAKDQLSLDHANALVDRTSTRLQVASMKHRRPKR